MSLLWSLGENPSKGRGIYRFSTAATLKEPITPPVQISYTQLLINGKFVDAASGSSCSLNISVLFSFSFYLHFMNCSSSLFLVVGKTFSAYDPRTGEVLAHVAEGDVEDVNRAVVAARKAFDEGLWQKISAYVRISLSGEL